MTIPPSNSQPMFKFHSRTISWEANGGIHTLTFPDVELHGVTALSGWVKRSPIPGTPEWEWVVTNMPVTDVPRHVRWLHTVPGHRDQPFGARAALLGILRVRHKLELQSGRRIMISKNEFRKQLNVLYADALAMDLYSHDLAKAAKTDHRTMVKWINGYACPDSEIRESVLISVSAMVKSWK